MDKNKIKSFAIWARRKMIESVTDKARNIGIFIDDKSGEYNELKASKVQGGFKIKDDSKIFNLSFKDREALIVRIHSYEDRVKGFKEVMEEVAYTWFNRFMALRYMEANDYLPSGIRILSSEMEGKTEPDALTKVYSLIDELKLDINKVDRLMDDTDENGNEKTSIQKQEDTRELYKYILVRQCNELGSIIPQMFEKISDYTELLLPDNLLEKDFVIRKMVEDIEESDFREEKDSTDENKNTGGVEIIGWMYQYYISEKKDEVFDGLKKNVKITKENIPAATQLFTPKWIVKYMVENSLGRLWLEGHPNEELQSKLKYYLEEAEQEPEVEEELKKIREEHSKLKPEDIKLLDPCMGSGHILVYAFDVLYEIYKTAGYTERKIPQMILQNNLYGLDIDDRAAQLASFALIMKARSYNRRLFREIEREHLELNLCSIQESNSLTKEAIDYFCSKNNSENKQNTEEHNLSEIATDTALDNNLRDDIEYLVQTFNDAKEYGSILEVKEVNFEALEERLKEIEQEETLMYDIELRNSLLEVVPGLIKQAKIMSRKYEVCVTNPPYMSIRGANNKLSKHIYSNYNKYKSDLFSIFIMKCLHYINKNGYTSMITMQSWMFLSSFQDMRKLIINHNIVNSLVQIGYNSFPSLNSQVAHAVVFVIQNKKLSDYNGVYFNLNNGNISADKNRVFKDKIKAKEFYLNKMDEFKLFPMYSFVYYASNKVKNIFRNNKKFCEISEVKQGMTTSDNNRFLREWSEIYYNKIGLHYNCCNETLDGKHKWFPYNKGGDMRKWYGNNEFVVNYECNGKEMKKFHKYLSKTSPGGRIKNQEYYFKKGLTWSKISTDGFTVRYVTKGFIFDVGGSCIFNMDELYQLGFLNSKVAKILLNYISPTINYEAIHINSIPICNSDKQEVVHEFVKKNIKISKTDWDSFETSWDFKVHPLLKSIEKDNNYKLNSVFDSWETEAEDNFNKLKANEEELNRIFINIYGLQDELTPEVEDKDITIRKAHRERDIKSFISYAVGCMFGRYSLYKPGLIFAGYDKKCDEFDKTNGDEKCKFRWKCSEAKWDYKLDYSKYKSYIPDNDNVIPITEDEYFEDDIVSRFINFVKVVYGEKTLEENLDFIADSIGRKTSETARQSIRRYFIKDFYKDHVKIYKKRPIYWMFNSGKNNGFKALIYMHRYNEQTVAKVRTDYLHELQKKYEGEINRQQLIVDSEDYSKKDRNVAKKKINKIQKQIEECREYDQVVAHLANEKIAIDLDDGVKVNYAKFQGIKVINSKDKEVKMNLLSKI